jgi:hypothetical protein
MDNKYCIYQSHFNKCFELLINHGFIPNYKDVLEAAKRRIELPNISRFNITFDDKLLEYCDKYNFFPLQYKIDGVDDGYMKLCHLINNEAKQNEILTHFKLFPSLKPTPKVMELACKHKKYSTIINTLIEKGGTINIQCLENSIKSCTTNYTLRNIFDQFKKLYDKQIKELINIKDQYDIVDETTSTQDDYEEEEESIILNDSEENKEEDKLNIITIHNSNNTPNDKRKQVKIPTKYKRYFKITTKSMSYIELKKDFINRIRKNKWILPFRKDLINLPIKLRSLLNINKDGYIRYSNIEDIISHFY